jgi:hypothetical protein
MTSLTLRGGGVFSPELGRNIVGGDADANTAMLLRNGLFARRGLLLLAWLPGGLKVLLSLSISALALEAAPATDTLWIGRTSASVSRLGRLGLVLRADIVYAQGVEEIVRFRFSDAQVSGVNGGERASVWARADSESCRTQASTRDIFVATVNGDNSGEVAMMVELSGGCASARSGTRHSNAPKHA